MNVDLAPRPLPLITADLPGIGGAIRTSPEDFFVEEVPVYLPAGEGEHLYLWVEKVELASSEAARLLAAAAGVGERDVGYAGQKDRHARTRQWFSVHTKLDAIELDDARLKVLEASRHGNKLKLGHLRGNRFRIVVRNVSPEAPAIAAAVVDRLSRVGLPNFYGVQRFGRDGDNAQLGAALLGVGEHPQLARAKRDRFLRRLALSSLQSELFNRCLTERMNDALWTTVLDGDVLRRRDSGGMFTTGDPPADQERLDRGELDVTGPMLGWKERPASRGEALAREEQVLAQAGLTRELLRRGRDETQGARRPYRIPVEETAVETVAPDAVALSFKLPSGSYATRVLAEVMKGEEPAAGEAA